MSLTGSVLMLLSKRSIDTEHDDEYQSLRVMRRIDTRISPAHQPDLPSF
jgi:hypothetical protein